MAVLAIEQGSSFHVVGRNIGSKLAEFEYPCLCLNRPRDYTTIYSPSKFDYTVHTTPCPYDPTRSGSLSSWLNTDKHLSTVNRRRQTPIKHFKLRGQKSLNAITAIPTLPDKRIGSHHSHPPLQYSCDPFHCHRALHVRFIRKCRAAVPPSSMESITRASVTPAPAESLS